MSRLNLRRKPRVSYCEIEEPKYDEYIYCDKCADFVYEYCSIHGPLLVIPDDKVPAKPAFPPCVPRAALTIPHVFLHIARSVIPGAGLGVFSTLTLPRGVRFGPYLGRHTDDVTSTYCWMLHDGNNKWSHAVDAGDASTSNWMRYVNCSRHYGEQNLVAYQYQGQIYYRTIRTIPRFTELLVFYGKEFASLLDIDLRHYNSTPKYVQCQDIGNSNTLKHIEVNDKVTESNKVNEIVTENNNAKYSRENNIQQNKENITEKGIDKHEHMGRPLKIKHNRELQKKRTHDTPVTDDNNNCKFYGEITNNSSENQKDRDTIQNCTSSVNSTPKTKSVEKPYRCEYCNYTCAKQNNLERHTKRHTGEKPYKCEYCNYSCISKTSLTYHIRTHSGEKPYKCEYCNYSCIQKTDLTSHIRTHTGEKPYKCEYCNYSCILKTSLTYHIRTHTGEKPYKCEYCNYSCIKKKYLRNHTKTHIGEKS